MPNAISEAARILCPTCGALPGVPCVRLHDGQELLPHRRRMERAAWLLAGLPAAATDPFGAPLVDGITDDPPTRGRV